MKSNDCIVRSVRSKTVAPFASVFPAPVLLRRVTILLGTALSGLLAGCGGTVSTPFTPTGTTGTTGTTPAGYVFLTGNWEFTATPTGGLTPFTILRGFIKEEDDAPGTSDYTTAVFQAASPRCYLNEIPLSGTLAGSTLTLRSFSVQGQYVTLNATKSTDGSALTGTYKIGGGCANGATGTISGVMYSSLTGTYTGNITGSSPLQTIQLQTSQSSQGTGSGQFTMSGSAQFTGFSCFTKGSLASAQSYVIGSQAYFVVTTDDASGAELLLTGTFNQAADTITLSSIVVTSGSCSGTLGGSTLSLQ